MIKCIIVDDELPARECIRNFLKDYCRDVEVVAQADSANTALTAILDHHPDLVFLDVEMPNGNGFDLLRMLTRIDFSIIFVTAYEEYAVTAFRFSATDFLLKPINIKELIEAVDKVRMQLQNKTGAANIETLKRLTQSGPESWNVLVIPASDGFKVVRLQEIITCEADGYCTIFHLKDQGKIVSTKNLKYYDEFLSGYYFMRVHNSHLVNLHQIREYSSEGVIKLADEIQAPLGNTYKKKFLEYFERNK
jgi:two-component system, LytTR family, response regulator